jgi:hypothetical protein
MAVALQVLVQRQPGFRLGARPHLRLARPELGWLQGQADLRPQAPVTPAMPPPPQEMSMQRANSLALEEARPQAREKKQVKLRAALWLANLPAQQSLRGSRSAQAKCRG